MTNSPACLQAPRNLMIQHLDAHPGKAVDDDLDPDEVGIVGDPKHRGGYHCGSDRVDADDYSVRESPRDKAGLTKDACALDVGWFEWRNPRTGELHTLRTFSRWAVAECEAGAPDTRDVREIIYSLDGKTVRRWDRLKKRSTGDSSHLFHTHFSFFRDAIKAGRSQLALFVRYLTEIGLLEGDVALDDTDVKKVMGFQRERTVGGKVIMDPAAYTLMYDAAVTNGAALAALTAKVEALAAKAPVALTDADRADIAARVRAGLPTDLAEQLADKLAARLQD